MMVRPKIFAKRVVMGAALAASIAALCVLSGGAYAQKIGTGVVDGRVIDIFDDFSWRYQDSSEPIDNAQNLCTMLDAYARFCNDGSWKAVRSPSSRQIARYILDENRHALIFAIDVGLEDGVQLDDIRRAVIQSVANDSGVEAKDIPVISSTPIERFGMRGVKIILQANFQGNTIIYINSVFVGKRTYQLITYRVGADYGEDDEILHQKLTESVALN